MIVPTKRLIFLSAVILISASLLSIGYMAVISYVILGLVLFFSVIIFDIFWGKTDLQTLTVSSAPIVRMVSERWSVLPLFFEKPESQNLLLHIIPILPELLQLRHKNATVHIPKGEITARMDLDCRAHRRGRFHLNACYVGQYSKLGMWIVRRKYKLDSEIRVYPNLISGQKHVLGLFHRRDWGWRNLRKIGKGREFEQLREYLPGDSYEDMDWKATARRRYPIVRDFEVEQSQEIYIILDASRLSTRPLYSEKGQYNDQKDIQFEMNHPNELPVSAKTIFEHHIIGALTMAMAADRAADRYGLLIFGSKPEIFLKAGRGKSHYNACMEALYNYMPQTVSPDFEEVFAFIGSNIRKRALLVFLTCLDDPLLSENFVNTMSAVNRKHVIMVNMIRPKGAYSLFTSPLDSNNPKDGDKQIYEKLLGHMIWSSLSTTRRKLYQFGAGFKLLDDTQLSSQLIEQYREIKQRQIL